MGHHAHLNVAGDAELALDALLGGGGGFELVVGILELAVGCLNLLRVLVAAVEDEGHGGDDQGGDDGQHGHQQVLGMLALLLGFHL